MMRQLQVMVLALMAWELCAYLRTGSRRFNPRLLGRRRSLGGLYCAPSGDGIAASLPADDYSSLNEMAFADDDRVAIGASSSRSSAPLGERTAALTNSGRNTTATSSGDGSRFEKDGDEEKDDDREDNEDDDDDDDSNQENGDSTDDDDDGGTKMVDKDLSKIYKEEDEGGGDPWAFIESKRTFDELTDSEYQRVMDLALDTEHKQTLGKKVEAVMEQEWDIQQGVTTSVKQQPTVANLDLATYHARQAMVKRGNFSEAAEIYQRCIEFNPVDGRAWLGLARIYQKRGFPLEAEKCFKDGLYYNPKNPFLLQSWAVMLEKQGKVVQATKLLRTSVIANPKHSASWVALGQINQRKGRIEEARYCFRSAVEGDPRSYVALQAWGVLESKSGRLNEARGLFKKALKQSRNSVHTLQAWATLERKQGNLGAAEKLLGRALKEWPKSTRSRVGLAEIRELRGDTEQALKTFELGAKFAAKCGDAGFFQSWALLEARVARAKVKEDGKGVGGGGSSYSGGDFDGDEDKGEGDRGRRKTGSGGSRRYEPLSDGKAAKIRSLFRRAIEVNKYHSASWIAWAKFEQHNGNPDVARRLLTEGMNNFPHSKNQAWFHTALGNLAWHRGDVTTARACYTRALDASPPQRSLSILLEYAKMEERLGSRRGTEARELYEKAVSKFPREERVWSAYIDFERRKERLPPSPLNAAAVSVDGGAASGSDGDDESLTGPTQIYNPGGAVNSLIQRRKEVNSMAKKKPKLVATDWEENLEKGGI